LILLDCRFLATQHETNTSTGFVGLAIAIPTYATWCIMTPSGTRGVHIINLRGLYMRFNQNLVSRLMAFFQRG